MSRSLKDREEARIVKKMATGRAIEESAVEAERVTLRSSSAAAVAETSEQALQTHRNVRDGSAQPRRVHY